jgi:steroid 5-alpha reductase family enzyme
MNKWQSIGIIFILYVLAFFGGLYSITYLNEPIWFEVFVFDIVMTIIIYLFSLLLKNASLYDPYWSVIPPVLMIYVMIELNAFGFLNIVMLSVLSVWAIRLTYNWSKNFDSFKHQDWRYDLIKEKTKRLYPLANFLGIQLFPTLIVYAQIYVIIAVAELNLDLGLFALIPSLVVLISVYIQFVSDKQMYEFRQQTVKKRVIDTGLWQYSRHPNYFGEIMVWWGMYLFYFSATMRFDFLITAPILMTLLFVFISIPMMEQKILSTRPEYKDYQATTSMLIPLVPLITVKFQNL